MFLFMNDLGKSRAMLSHRKILRLGRMTDSNTIYAKSLRRNGLL